MRNVLERSKELHKPYRDIAVDMKILAAASKQMFSDIRLYIKEKLLRLGMKLSVVACNLTKCFMREESTNFEEKTKGNSSYSKMWKWRTVINGDQIFKNGISELRVKFEAMKANLWSYWMLGILTWHAVHQELWWAIVTCVFCKKDGDILYLTSWYTRCKLHYIKVRSNVSDLKIIIWIYLRGPIS